jgi:hypothetical protein
VEHKQNQRPSSSKPQQSKNSFTNEEQDLNKRPESPATYQANNDLEQPKKKGEKSKSKTRIRSASPGQVQQPQGPITKVSKQITSKGPVKLN